MLFDIENQEVVISPQALQIAAFRTIWTRDRDKYKVIAKKELAYVYYMSDYKSPYMNKEENERQEMIIRSLFKDERDPRLERVREWKPDEVVNNAIAQYRYLNESPTMKLLQQTKNSIIDADRLVRVSRSRLTALLDQLETGADIENIEKMGAQAVLSFQTILKIAETIPEIHKTLSSVEEMIKQEIAGKPKIRGGGTISKREM